MLKTVPSSRTSLGLAALALFVAAANLRPAIAAVSPLVDDIRADLDLSATEVSLLTTVPTLAMGLCAPLGAYAGRRYGLQSGVLAGLIIIALATGARLFGTSVWWQLGSAAIVGAGIAIVQTLLPAVIKSRFAARAGLLTGLFTSGLGLGGAVAAGMTAPLANAFDSWPAALASWSVLALSGAVLWTAGKGSLSLDGVEARTGPATGEGPWRSGTAWRITILSAVNAALYYCDLAWVAPLLHDDSGRDAATAGVMLTVMISIQVVAMLAVPALLGERRSTWRGLAAMTVLTGIGFLGLALAPGAGAWVWIVVLGVGHGGLFTLVLALPVLVGRDPGDAGRISAMAFFVGYGCAALAGLLVGALRDLTGGFTLSFGLLGGLALLMLLPIAHLRKTVRL
ncbi:MFS transporter [Nocardia fusca]|uniref:MFS transporter n=1 Tax=Nocardia fusca TaxID=941183 RepID=UPI0007A746A2|nr:MFS transporter [Nocardia fusca]